MREQIKMFYINWANKCINKGGYKNIKKGLKLLEISLMFATDDEREFLRKGIMGIVTENK